MASNPRRFKRARPAAPADSARTGTARLNRHNKLVEQQEHLDKDSTVTLWRGVQKVGPRLTMYLTKASAALLWTQMLKEDGDDERNRTVFGLEGMILLPRGSAKQPFDYQEALVPTPGETVELSFNSYPGELWVSKVEASEYMGTAGKRMASIKLFTASIVKREIE